MGAPGRRHRGAGRRARPSRAERSRRVGESCISARARSRGRPWAVRGRSDAAVHTAARARGRRRGAALRSCARQRALRPAAGPRRLAREAPSTAEARIAHRSRPSCPRHASKPSRTCRRGLRGMPAADQRVHAQRPDVRPSGACSGATFRAPGRSSRGGSDHRRGDRRGRAARITPTSTCTRNRGTRRPTRRTAARPAITAPPARESSARASTTARAWPEPRAASASWRSPPPRGRTWTSPRGCTLPPTTARASSA